MTPMCLYYAADWTLTFLEFKQKIEKKYTQVVTIKDEYFNEP